jgi:hypothetical protein
LAVARSCERAAAGPRKALVAQGGAADNKIDGDAESRCFFLSFVQVLRKNQTYLPGKEYQPTRIQWDGCG